MDLADEAVARLNRLALFNDGNLVLMMRDLVRSAVASAPSCVAVIIAVGQEAPLYAIDDRLRDGTAVVRASLRAQIITTGGKPPGHQVVFLAERPGEFVDFAAMPPPVTAPADYCLQRIVIDGDLTAATGLTLDRPVMDDASDPARAVDQAVGILLDRGYPPAEALQELRRRAQAGGLDLRAQAELVLRALN